VESYSYYSNSLSVCSDSSIDVTGVSLLCDTPGVWYYGSSGYRNSQSCQKGDKATLTVTFDIVDEDLSEYIYLTLKCFGGDQEVIVYQNALLCSIGALSESSGVSCPYQGSFSMSTKFYFDYSSSTHDDDAWNDRYLGDDDSDDSVKSYSFTPMVSVGFASSNNGDEYDLGGANTDLCAGQSKNIQSDIVETVQKSVSHPIVSFLLSFVLLITVLAALVGSTYYIWNSPLCNKNLCESACESDRHMTEYERAEADLFEDDDRKLKLMRKNAAMLSL